MADFVKRAPFYCPDCGELDNTETFDVQFDDEIIHKARCCKCGCEFIDRYVPRYAGYSIEREDGWHEYDEYGDLIAIYPSTEEE